LRLRTFAGGFAGPEGLALNGLSLDGGLFELEDFFFFFFFAGKSQRSFSHGNRRE
jgi:hypothetical protein